MKNSAAYVMSAIAIAVVATWAAIAINMNSDWNRSRLNDGIFVGAPDDWRWVRDGIDIDHFTILAGDPVENHTKGLPDGTLGKVIYGANVQGAHHEFLFGKDGILRSVHWYVGLKEDNQCSIPEPIIHDALVVSYPRMVPMSWSGKSENGFEVEVDIKYPDDKWALSKRYYTSQNSAVHQHTGANAGRWKVRALSAIGGGKWSDYVHFECSQ